MSEPEMLRHPTLPIEAPRAVWVAAKFQTYANSERIGARNWGDNGFDALLVIAMSHGKTGADAIAFALETELEQSEQKTRSTAIARLADAIAGHASAIKPLDVRVVVEGIVGHLQERLTQFRR